MSVSVDTRAWTVRVAAWSAAHPKKAMGGWILFVALVFAVGTSVGTQQTRFQDFWVGEAGKAEQLAQEGGMAAPAREKVLIEFPDGDVAAAETAATELTADMNRLDEVADVSEVKRAADGDALLVTVTMSMPAHQAGEHVDALQDVTAQLRQDYGGLDIQQTGDKSISTQLDAQLGSDLGSAELLTLPVTLVILFLVFGSLLAAGIPLLLAITSIVASMGLYALVSQLFPDAGGAVVSVMVMMGMAVGVDYSLFYLKRARQEREAGTAISPTRAIELAAATSGRAVVASGIGVVVSLAGLYFAADVIFSSIATACAIVVLTAVASSVTVLPAVLGALGTRMDVRRRHREPNVWPKLLRPALRRPVATGLIALMVLLGLSTGVLGMKLSVEGNETFPKSLPAVAAYDDMIASFPDEGVVHSVVAKVPRTQAPQLKSAVDDLWSHTRGDDRFATSGEAKVRYSRDGGTAVVDLPTRYPASHDRAGETVEYLRGDLVPATIGRLGHAEYGVSGEPAYAVDYSAHQREHLPVVVGFILAAALIMMLIAFRSLVLAVIGLVFNLLSALAAWGAMVWVFQGEWAEGLLGFHSSGFIGSRTPLMVFVILFGLALDYQVFVISSMRESVLRGVDFRRAVSEGIASSAGVITSAAVIMVSVFVAFMFIDRIEMKQLGFALALGVLLDAFVIRVALLPAAMTLLGRFAWWPSRLGAREGPAPQEAARPPARCREAIPVDMGGRLRRPPE